MVETKRSLVQRIMMSPMLITNESGMRLTSITSPEGVSTCRPPGASSMRRIVIAVVSVCAAERSSPGWGAAWSSG